MHFVSEGDVVFETGTGGQVQFMAADGTTTSLGEKVVCVCVSIDYIHRDSRMLMIPATSAKEYLI